MKRFAIACALWASLTSPLLAFDIDRMSPEERQIFREEVRAYLLEQPEVLIEAIGVLEQRQAAAEQVSDVDLVAANADALFSDVNSYVGGNLDGDILMVEFSDYRCGFCKRAHPEVTELVRSDGNIRYVVKEFPILGPESELASRFAISVLQNDSPEAYAKTHDSLMNFRGSITQSSLKKLAGKLDLDAALILGEMNSDAVSAVIAENRALAQRMNITGTPGFVFGNQMVRGYVPLDSMQQLVADIRSNSP